MEGEGLRPAPFYHVNDVSVYLVDREDMFSVLNQEQYVLFFFALQMFETLAFGAETTRKGLKLVLSIRNPSPPLGRH